MPPTPVPATGSDAVLPAPAVPAFSCALLVCGVFGLLPQLTAAAIAIAVSSGVYGTALLRTAWRLHRAAADPAMPRCQGAGLLGLAVLASAATVLVTVRGTGGYRLVGDAGLVLCTGLFLAALPLLPGTGSGRQWLVRALEAMSLGAAAMFALWVLALSTGPANGNPVLLSVALLVSAAVPVIVFGLLAAARRQPAVGYCHAGALLGVLGLAELTIAGQGVLVEIPVAGAFMIFGPMLIWYGARRHSRADRPVPPPPHALPGAVRAVPQAVPVLAVLATVLYQWHRDRQLDNVALSLGMALLVLLTFREWLARSQVRALAAELAWLRGRVGRMRHVPDRRRDRDAPGDRVPAWGHEPGWTDRPEACDAEHEHVDLPRTSVGHVRPGAQDSAAAHPHGGAHHLPGPVTRRRLLAEARLRGRGWDGEHGWDTSTMLVVGVRGDDGYASRGGDTVTDVQVVAGTAGLAAPLGDGRYVVLVDGGPARASMVAARLLDSLPQSFAGAGGTAAARAVSIGIAELASGAAATEALDQARQAQERADRLGTGVEWYDEHLAADEARRVALRRELPRALARDEFGLLYRPIVDVVSDRPVGAQALLQWSNPELGTVAADEFLPVADPEVLDGLSSWLLGTACRQVTCWQPSDVWLLLRTVRPFEAGTGLLAGVETALATAGVPADRLLLETTEDDVAAGEVAATEQLAALRALGARTCLADPGTGALPMSSLRRLPLDVLKIKSGGDGTLAVVTRLAQRYGLELLVDDVDSAASLARVRAAGCRLAAGPVFGPPLAGERFEALLRDFRSPVGPLEAT